MSIMDIFSRTPAAAVTSQASQAGQANQASGNGSEQGTQGGQAGQDGNQSNQGNEPTGLDRAKAWFEPAEGDAKPTNFDPAALFATTPEAQQALAAEIGKLNFIEGAATPEMVEAIQAGGDDAIKVLPALMNKVAQNAFSAAMKASMGISQNAFSKAAPSIESRMQELMRRNQVQDAVSTANPVLSHPSGKVIADALVNSFMQKYPNATPQELKDMANQYIVDIAGAGVPAKDESKGKDIMATDWANFFN